MSQIDLQWFAAEDEGKTEKPSEHRLRKEREEGRVPKSNELNGMAVLLVTVLLLVFMGPWLLNQFKEFVIFYFNAVTSSKVDDSKFFIVFITFFIRMVLPVSAAGFVAAIIINIVQNRGFIFTTKPLTPKFNKLIPKFGEYFKNTLFSRQGLFNIGKSIFKVAVISIVAFIILRNSLPDTMNFLHTIGPETALVQISGIISRLLIICSVILLIISIPDYFMQRSVFMDRLKMSKQEVKEEYKELEGDPEVKGHLEQAQREMLVQNIPKAVRESDVVITNPTHFAVALQYKNEFPAPKVMAKGEDVTAQTIKRIAYDNNISVVENRPLARSLYADTSVGDYIPEEYMRAIAVIYSEIGYMNKQKKGK